MSTGDLVAGTEAKRDALPISSQNCGSVLRPPDPRQPPYQAYGSHVKRRSTVMKAPTGRTHRPTRRDCFASASRPSTTSRLSSFARRPARWHLSTSSRPTAERSADASARFARRRTERSSSWSAPRRRFRPQRRLETDPSRTPSTHPNRGRAGRDRR